MGRRASSPGCTTSGCGPTTWPARPASLVAAGWTLRLAQRDPADGYGVFTYVQPPSGLLVELVSTAVQPMFERWFAGGPLA